MNNTPSVLPLSHPTLVEQAARFLCMQAALREAERVQQAHPFVTDQLGAMVTWLDPLVQDVLDKLANEPWWGARLAPDDAGAFVQALGDACQRLVKPSMPQVLQMASADSYLSLRMYFKSLASEPNKAEATADDVVRDIVDRLTVGSVPMSNMLWVKGEMRPSSEDGQIVPAEPEHIPLIYQNGFHLTLSESPSNAPYDGASYVLLTRLRIPNKMQEGTVACELGSTDPHHIYRVGQLCAMVDIIQLYGLHLQDKDERTTTAHVFAGVVAQQQHLMTKLEADGFRLDMVKPTAVPEGCEPINAFSLGVHEVLLREMRLIHDAKERNALVSQAMNAYDRLKGQIGDLRLADPLIPEADGGWLPSRKDLRRKGEMVAHVLAFVRKKESGDIAPVVYRIPAAPNPPPQDELRPLRESVH